MTSQKLFHGLRIVQVSDFQSPSPFILCVYLVLGKNLDDVYKFGILAHLLVLSNVTRLGLVSDSAN